jgi:hypothetical protein
MPGFLQSFLPLSYAYAGRGKMEGYHIVLAKAVILLILYLPWATIKEPEKKTGEH